MEDLRKRKNREDFHKVKYKKGESCYLFSARVQRLYKVSFPKHKTETSKLFQDKFMKTIPRKLRSVISSQIVANKVRQKETTWSIMQTCARYVDIQDDEEIKSKIENSDSSIYENPKEKEIIINIGQKIVKKDAATQDDVDSGISRIFYASQKKAGANDKYFQHQNDQGYYQNERNQQTSPDKYYDDTSGNTRSKHTNMRPPSSLTNRNVTCSYCDRLGHYTKNCRKRLNTCFICGKGGHYARKCYENTNYRSRSRSQGILENDRYDNEESHQRNFDRNRQQL